MQVWVCVEFLAVDQLLPQRSSALNPYRSTVREEYDTAANGTHRLARQK